jgi:hypothetical protein
MVVRLTPCSRARAEMLGDSMRSLATLVSVYQLPPEPGVSSD